MVPRLAGFLVTLGDIATLVIGNHVFARRTDHLMSFALFAGCGFLTRVSFIAILAPQGLSDAQVLGQ